jgi:hypothetical protein
MQAGGGGDRHESYLKFVDERIIAKSLTHLPEPATRPKAKSPRASEIGAFRLFI